MSLERHVFEFGEFVLDSREKVLFRAGEPIPITPRIFDLLLILVRNQGHIVEKSDLLNEVWAGSFVEESNLTFSIRQLRKILGDDAQHPRFIETIPRRGYRFLVPPGAERLNGTYRPGYYRADSAIVDAPRRSVLTRQMILAATAIIVLSLLVAGIFVRRRTAPLSDSAGLSRLETLVSSGSSLSAAISLDGRYVAYSSTANGQHSLWLRQLSSAVNTQIVAPEVDVTFHAIRFSSDGEYVYFVRRFRDGPTHLDRVSILGGAIRTNILTDLDGSFSISPDDSRVSFRRYEPGRRTLLVANIDGTDVRTVYETPKTFTDNVFSPDGRSIAFASGQSDTGDQDFGVYTLDLETGQVKTATEVRWHHVRGIVWLPRQEGLIVTAAQKSGHAMQLWNISLPGGEAVKLTDTPNNFSSISATADLSQILLTQVSGASELFLVSPDAPDNAQPIAEVAGGAALSPGGDLVYGSVASGNHDIWLLKADRATRKQLTTEDSVDYDPQVSPDGRFIVFVSDRAGKYNLWRMNIDGSEPVRLTSGDGEQNPVFTPDGAFVVFNSMKDVSLWKVPVAGGVGEQVSAERCRNVSFSPDGSKFAHLARKDGRMFAVLKTFPGAAIVHEFAIPDGYFAVPGIAWTKDGSALVYAAEDASSIGNLWKQPLAGGPAKKLTSYPSKEIFSLSFSPDGSQLAVIRGSWRHDVILATLRDR